MLDPEVISLLRCPVTHQPLRVATPGEKSAHGLDEQDEALASEDGSQLYRFSDGLPLLVSANEVTPAEEG